MRSGSGGRLPVRLPGSCGQAAACLAFNPTEWYAFSDHSPIVAPFEV
jgi:hypothetical protein